MRLNRTLFLAVIVLVVLFSAVSFAQINNGGGSGSGTGAGASPMLATIALSPNCPQANTAGCYYTPANTQIIQTCTFNTGTANVVCAAGTFASTDVGKYIFGWGSCNPFIPQPSAAVITTTHNTITAFVDSTTVTMNAVGASGSAAGTGCVIFGTPDDTAAAAVDAAFASLATTPTCPKLELAASQYMFTTPHFFTQPVGCAATPGLQAGGAQGNMFLAAGFELEGRGPGASIMWIPPDFPESGSCTHGNASNACFAVPLEGRFSNLQFSGGNGKAGSNMPNSSAFLNVDVGSLDYVTCTGIADLASGNTHVGILLTHWAQLNQVNVSACGDTGVQVSAGTQSYAYRLSSENANNVSATISANLNVSGGAPGAQFTCNTCNFYGTQTGTTAEASIIAGGGSTLKLVNSNIQTGVGNASVQFGYKCAVTGTPPCVLIADNDNFVPNGTTNSTALWCGVGCNIDISRSKIQAAGTGNTYINSQATSILQNRVGNTWTGGAGISNSGGGMILNSDPQGLVLITAAKAVLSGGWGSTAAWSALNGGNSFTGTITSAGTGQGASPTITYTFPTALPATYVPYCRAEQTGGTQAAGTFTVASVSATGATFTYSGTPIAANTVFVQIFCQ